MNIYLTDGGVEKTTSLSTNEITLNLIKLIQNCENNEIYLASLEMIIIELFNENKINISIFNTIWDRFKSYSNTIINNNSNNNRKSISNPFAQSSNVTIQNIDNNNNNNKNTNNTNKNTQQSELGACIRLISIISKCSNNIGITKKTMWTVQRIKLITDIALHQNNFIQTDFYTLKNTLICFQTIPCFLDTFNNDLSSNVTISNLENKDIYNEFMKTLPLIVNMVVGDFFELTENNTRFFLKIFIYFFFFLNYYYYRYYYLI
jgi:hypothetical protein